MTYVEQIQVTVRDLPREAAGAGRTLWLAGLGAAGIVGRTAATVFSSLVEEGRAHEARELERAEALVSDARKSVTRVVQDAARQVQGRVEQATAGVLHHAGMPSRRDVAVLGARIEAVTARVNAARRHEGVHVD